MKKAKNLLTAVFALMMCVCIVSATDAYGSVSIGFGQDWGDSGFYFQDCILFDAAILEDTVEDEATKIITMKPGSSVHFFKGDQFDSDFMSCLEEEGGGIYYSTYVLADGTSENMEYYAITLNGVTYVPSNGEMDWVYVTEKKSVTTDELFAEGVSMIDFNSGFERYFVILEGNAQPSKPAQPAEPAKPATPPEAIPNASPVLVNGQTVSFDAYNINGNNYFKLRDLAYVLSGSEKQFEVTWDNQNKAINLVTGMPYTVLGGEMAAKGDAKKQPVVSNAVIYIDGVQVELTAYNIDNNNYFKLRDLGQTLDFEVDWDAANKTIVIDTAKTYTPD